jgi:hypothetical protein
MKKPRTGFGKLSAFSLAEMLAALVIGTMVFIAVLAIYSRSETSVNAVMRRLDSSQLPAEVIQTIAEDIDKMVVTTGSDTKITIDNKFEHGYPTAKLEILKTIYDGKDAKQTFEKITWQGSYDNAAGCLVLYRCHSGIAAEDKLLDRQKEDWEKELFVPVCSGVTFFRIQVPIGSGFKDFRDKWDSDALPPGIVVTLSFAEPLKTLAGALDVPDTEKITRTIAVDRTRKIKFTFVLRETGGEKSIKDVNDANDLQKNTGDVNNIKSDANNIKNKIQDINNIRKPL